MLIKLLKLIIYSIISNKHLKIESEDSLFDIIQNKFTNQSENSEDCIDIISFYEEIDFSGLSESKFRDFLNKFDFNEMTGLIWAKLRQCFHFTSFPFSKNNHFNLERYLYKGKCYEFIEEKKNCFKRIIHHLTKETGGNVNDNGTILVTASSVCNGHFPKHAVDLDDNLHYFQSVAMQDSWLKYDFKDRKIRPSKYSIRTRHDCD